MSCRRAVLSALLGALAAFAPAPVNAQTHPNFARGFEPGKAYQIGDVDSVSLFNGSLTLTIPIGPTYPVGGTLSYGLTLTYSTGSWLFQEECHEDDFCLAQVVPSRHFRAGLGWTVSLGEMVFSTLDFPAFYRGPDGAEHRFWQTLHNDDPINPGVWYTRDGTYLRYTVAGRVLEFPDGLRHFFDAQGRLTQIADRFGNALTVDQTGNPWKLDDSLGRHHEVHFKAGNTIDFPQVIDRIELEAPRDSPGTRKVQTYTFEYPQNPVTVRRPYPHNDTTPPLGPTVQVPLLTGVQMPEGLRWEMTGYNTGWVPNNRAPGSLQGLRLPTLGRLEWDYTLYKFSTGSALDPNDPKRRILTNALGVSARRVIDPIGGSTGAWQYDQTVVLPPPGVVEQPVEATNTVIDPLGHKTVHYFSAYFGGPTSWPALNSDYARPYTIRTSDGASPPRYLSSQVYDSSGQHLRTTWLRHERDEFGPDIENDADARVAGSRTVYHDDSNRIADTDFSDFDGLGHYRTTTTGGTFGAGDLRTTTTTYNADRGTYKVDPVTHLRAPDSTFTMLPSSAPWILGTFGESKVSEGGFTERTLVCFDPKGFLDRRRVLRNPAGARVDDLLVTYGRNPLGQLTGESFYGGDGAALSTSNLCGFTPPAAEAVRVQGWSNGVPATSQWGGVSHLDLDQTIDLGTGLAVASRDTAGLQVDFEHDLLGRRTWEKPAAGQGGYVQYAYTAPNLANNSPASVYVRRRANAGGKSAEVLAESEILFDGLGRVWRERELLPSGWSTRETRYDGAGNRSWVSESQSGNPTKATELLGYDPFGRPTTIRPPDGQNHDVTLNYAGVRRTTRTVRVGTTRNSQTGAITEQPSGTTELYDRQGRLWKVTEPSGEGGADVTTVYSYDAGNRLRTVSTPATVNGTAIIQDRSFTYDPLGLLRSETHPEKGPNGNGTVTYGNYDARGNARRKTDGPSDLAFAFDAAGRLTTIKEAAGALRPLKEYGYGTTNADRGNGRMVSAARHNYVPQGDALLTTIYQYLGRDGRVSGRTVQLKFNGTPAETFTQSFTYTPLGDLRDLVYPVCTHAGCQPRAPFFADVPAGFWAKPEIEAIQRAGVTAGCGGSPPNYCPNSNHNRAQMAVFLLVAKEGAGYQPPPCVAPLFGDVPCTDPFARWINELANRGITAGCGGGNFCPGNPVSHGQMAVFLLRTWETGYTAPPATCSPLAFGDVPCTDPFAPWIEEVSRRGIWPGCGGGNYCPGQPVTRAQMAVLLSRTFAIPVETQPNLPRTVAHDYDDGLLTNLPGYGAVSYHPNGMWSQIQHANRVTDTQASDPNAMRRPASLSAAFGTSPRWGTGAYTYDGSGNIVKLGTTTWFLYDKVSRLVQGNLDLAPTGAGAQLQQTYAFDPFGNLQAIAGANGRNTPTNPDTNRLTGAVNYDGAGNLTNWNGALYEYDAFHQMTRMVSGVEEWRYAYTADGERAWLFKVGGNHSRWTLRNLDGKVLREYLNEGGVWSTASDYIYRDGQLLAAETATGPRHFHLDHLGTPRLITDRAGRQAAYHVYFPFGEEATAVNQDAERMKFTGHERDLASAAGAGDDLDSMHARHCSPLTGRFLSTDPSFRSAKQGAPQSWNRYSYTYNNPMRFVDPDGENPIIVIGAVVLGAFLLSSEAANSPESADTAMIASSDGTRGLGAAALLSGPAAFGLARTGGGGMLSELNAAFSLHPVARGNLIEKILAAAGGALPRYFPVIDRFKDGVATSVKSLDLRAATYQNIGRLTSTLRGYVDRLAGFGGITRGGHVVRGSEITSRVLEIVVQRNALTEEQALSIVEAGKHAQQNGVIIRVIMAR